MSAIVAIHADGYKVLELLSRDLPREAALRKLCEWSLKRLAAVVLRDADGKRVSVGEALEALGAPWTANFVGGRAQWLAGGAA